VSDYQQCLSLEIQRKDLVETKDVITSLSTGDVQGMHISYYFAVHYGSIFVSKITHMGALQTCKKHTLIF